MKVATDFNLRSIDLYIVSYCNRRCTYCLWPTQFLRSNQVMSLKQVRSVISWATTHGSPIREITLLGGEPSKHPQFAEIVLAIKAAGLDVRVVTNGCREFRAAVAKAEVARALSRVSVSLDSPDPAVFDVIRGPKAFLDVMLTIELLRRRGVPFDINCTVLQSTVAAVPQMITFAEDLGAGRLNIHWLSIVGRAREHAADEAVSARQWRWVLGQVGAFKPTRPTFRVDCELGFAFGLPGEDRHMCAVRGPKPQNLQFLPSGAVFSCGMLVEDESLSGYIFDWPRERLLVRPGITELAKTASVTDGCPLIQSAGPPVSVCIYNRLRSEVSS